MSTSRARLRIAWLVCLTLLANLYIVPALGQRAGADALFLGTICSVNPSHQTRAASGEPGAPETSKQASHCALCASQAGDLPLLPAAPQLPPIATPAPRHAGAPGLAQRPRPPHLHPDAHAPPLA